MSSLAAVSKSLAVHSVLALPQYVAGWLQIRTCVVDDLCATARWQQDRGRRQAALPLHDQRCARPHQRATSCSTLTTNRPYGMSFVRWRAQQRVGKLRRRSACRIWSADLTPLTRCCRRSTRWCVACSNCLRPTPYLRRFQ